MASELARAYVQIVPTADGMKGQLEDLLGKESNGVGETAGTNIGNSIGSFIKKALVAIGIGDFIKDSIMKGADLEQSLGGIETLFKDSSDEIVAYANNAWQTAGMSANEYMETATGFAASLLQGVAGDTEQAAQITDMAITDMSDNANKMGTDMELIQNAYQGFAKQNYTMLDNLKLGYGGTKSEMERLLADAKELTGVEYNIDNLADVYNAIHVIQGKLGVTGTTAEEASTTISGSINAVKAAWENLQADMVLGNDVSDDIDALSETVLNAASNLLPAISNLLSALPPVLIELVQELGPPLIEAIFETVSSLASSLSESLPELINSALDAMFQVVDAIIGNLDVIISAGVQLLLGLVTGILSAIPDLIAQVPLIIDSLLSTLLDLIPEVIQAGLEIFSSLAEDLPGIISNLTAIIPKLISSIISTVIKLIPMIIETGVKLLSSLVSDLPTIIRAIVDVIPSIVLAITQAIADLIPMLIDVGFQLFIALIKLLPQVLLAMADSAYQIVDGLIAAFTECGPDMMDIGQDMLDGIWQGISNGWNSLVESVKQLASGLVSGIKEVLGIHSPSRVFKEEVGKMVDLGLAEGITGNMNAVDSAMGDLNDAIKDNINTDVAVRATYAGRMATESGYAGESKESSVLEQLLQAVLALSENLASDVAEGMEGTSIKINNREFARLVKAVTV